MATIEDFQKIEMRVGRVVAVEDFPEARNPSYKLTIDFGAHGTRRSSAAVRRWYEKSDLQDRLVVCVRKTAVSFCCVPMTTLRSGALSASQPHQSKKLRRSTGQKRRITLPMMRL